MGDSMSSCCAVESAEASKQTVKISKPRTGKHPSSDGQQSSRRYASIDKSGFSHYREHSGQTLEADGSKAVVASQHRECTSRNFVASDSKTAETKGSASKVENVVISCSTKAELVKNEDLSDPVTGGTPVMALDHSEVSSGLQKPAAHRMLSQWSPNAFADKAEQLPEANAIRRHNSLPLRANELAPRARAPVVPDDYEQMDSIRSAVHVNGPRDRQEQRASMGAENKGNDGGSLIESERRIGKVVRTKTRREDEASAVSEPSTVTCSCSRSTTGSAMLERHRKISITSSMCSGSYCCSECNSSMVESSTPRESDGRCSSSCSLCANSLHPAHSGHCLCGEPSDSASSSCLVVQGTRCFQGTLLQDQPITVARTDEQNRSSQILYLPNGARQRHDRGAASKSSEADKTWSLTLPPGNEEHQRAPSLPSYATSSHCSEITSRSSCVTFSMEEKDSNEEQHSPGHMSENRHDALSPSSPEVGPKFNTAPASDSRLQRRPQRSSFAVSFPSPCSAASFPARLQSAGADSPSGVDNSVSHLRCAMEASSNPSFYFTPPGSGGCTVRSSTSSTVGLSARIAATVPCTPPATPVSANGGQGTAVLLPLVPNPGSYVDRQQSTLVGVVSTPETTDGDTRTEHNSPLGGCTKSEAADQRGKPSREAVTNAGIGDGDMTSAETEMTSFICELQNGIGIVVLLQDGTRLLCQLTLIMSRRALAIRCNEKVRIINVSDIQNLLYGRRELRKVETDANIKNDSCCVALHLVDSGNCIPLHFETQQRAMMFVDIIQHLKLTNNTATPPSPSPSSCSSSSIVSSPINTPTDPPSVSSNS
eukprot:GHVS01105837.1.p1 GENE.GHVS01105837.1~~GHVS01105837.1.p1  ORF type:complete len:825 (+),score=94.22 GHVS01105837.1:415-2889(+)